MNKTMAILLIPVWIILAWFIYLPIKIIALPMEWMIRDLKKLKL